MSRFVIRILAILMTLAFLGCGSSVKSSSGDAVGASKSTTGKQYPSQAFPTKDKSANGYEAKPLAQDESVLLAQKSNKGQTQDLMPATESKKQSEKELSEEIGSDDKEQPAPKTLAKQESKKKYKAGKNSSGTKTDQDKARQKALKEKQEKDKLSEEVKQAKVLYLSADDSNSMASPVIARKMIDKGRYVPGDIIRTYEFLNYYTFAYQPPEKEPLKITATLNQKDKKDEYTFQAAIKSSDKSFKNLKSFNVTFLMDISGSMAGESIELSKKFILGFASKLKKGSILSIVTCNKTAQVLLDSHKVGDKTQQTLKELFNEIQVNNVTDLEKGIVKAYDLASKNFSSNYLNRVIVISDGATNTGKLAVETIAKHAEDSDKQGIYLAGIGMGEGFNDQLMDAFTDKGKGAYLFIDSEKEISHILEDRNFIANFDLALKDIRLKMILPDGWKMKEFHGEKVSTKASDIIPQYLAPNAQMIYHMVLSTDRSLSQIAKQQFTFEAEYMTLGAKSGKVMATFKGSELLEKNNAIIKGDAIVEYAEMFKKIKYPLDINKQENLKNFEKAYEEVSKTYDKLKDSELSAVLTTLKKYKKILEYGEQFPESRDKNDDSIGAALGISPNLIQDTKIIGDNPNQAVKTISRLLNSTRLMPQEGYKMLAISSGPVGSTYPAGGGALSSKQWKDPTPEYMGYQKAKNDNKPCYDFHQVTLKLKAPKNAKSFSFDFNFFSAEYPNFVKKNFNDSFYAILKAKSTNNGAATNISFDSLNNSIEVDNNYFENEFHPIPNIGTGFDQHGSTGWLRTSWPIKGGEEFTISFSVHDEGDGIYDSLVLIDHFMFHDYEANGTTDPLN